MNQTVIAALLTRRLGWLTALLITLATAARVSAQKDDAPKPKEPPLGLIERTRLEFVIRDQDATAGQLFNAGKYDEAIKIFERSLYDRRRMFPKDAYPDGHELLAIGLSNVGAALDSIGRVADALPYLQDALAMRRKLYPAERYPKSHAGLVLSLMNYGGCLVHNGRHADAESLFEEAVRLSRLVYPMTTHPNGHERQVHALVGRGSCLIAIGRLNESLSPMEEALAMARKLDPPRPGAMQPILSHVLHEIAAAAMLRGELRPAQAWSEELVAIVRRDYPATKFPQGHPKLASALANHGVLLQRTGRPTEGLPLLLEALKMRNAFFPAARYPAGHPDLASCLHNVGIALDDIGRTEEALMHLAKSLRMYRSLYPVADYPDGHEDFIRPLASLGIAYKRLDRPADALRVHREALAVAEGLFPPAKYHQGHPRLLDAIRVLALALDEDRQATEARTLSERALTMAEMQYPAAKYPHGHIELAIALNNHATLLNFAGESQRAVPIMERCRSMMSELRPPGKGVAQDIMLDVTEVNLGAAYIGIDQPERALPLLENAMASMIRRADSLAQSASDAETLAALYHLPLTRDLLLSATRTKPALAAPVYAQIWQSKAVATRAAEDRQRALRILLAQAPEVQQQWRTLVELRRELARVLHSDSTSTSMRDDYLRRLTDEIQIRERELHAKVPALAGAERRRATTADLKQALPSRSTFIDIIAYRVQQGHDGIWHYAAFVMASCRSVSAASSWWTMTRRRSRIALLSWLVAMSIILWMTFPP